MELLRLYRPDQSQVHEVFGGIDLYACHQTKKLELFMKEYELPEPELGLLEVRLRQRQLSPHPNLLRVYEVSRNPNDAICGTTDTLLVYCEYLEHNLRAEIDRRRFVSMTQFSQKQRTSVGS